MEPLSPPRNAGISKPPKLCHLYKTVHVLTDFPGAPTEQQQFRFHQFHLAFSQQNPSKTDPKLLSMCNGITQYCQYVYTSGCTLI